MSKSRYSKTKAAGEAVSLSVYGNNYKQKARLVMSENRQMRRMRQKGMKK